MQLLRTPGEIQARSEVCTGKGCVDRDSPAGAKKDTQIPCNASFFWALSGNHPWAIQWVIAPSHCASWHFPDLFQS